MKKNYLPKNKGQNLNNGYTLLFAVLVSSVALGIGISILNIAKKEFLIATSARDSSAAFYAADSGIECAISADLAGAFNPDTDETSKFNCNLPKGFTTIDLNPPEPDTEGIFVFHIRSGSTDTNLINQSALQLAGKSCATVTVTKTLLDGNVRTTIDSRGYNIGWRAITSDTGACDQASAKRVERGIRYAY